MMTKILLIFMSLSTVISIFITHNGSHGIEDIIYSSKSHMNLRSGSSNNYNSSGGWSYGK
jgi:hypothetical protein